MELNQRTSRYHGTVTMIAKEVGIKDDWRAIRVFIAFFWFKRHPQRSSCNLGIVVLRQEVSQISLKIQAISSLLQFQDDLILIVDELVLLLAA